MSNPERSRAIGSRYRNRREEGKAGWASDVSYRRKATAFDRLVASYKIDPKARVLELGCGAGNTTIHIAKRGFCAYGVDMIPEAIAWARQKATDQGVVADFRVECVTELSSFEDESLDLIFDGDCLWMVLGEDREKCFTNVFRALKPEGVFFAQAHLADPRFTERYDIVPGAWFDPTTGISTVKDLPMYQFSTEADFRREIEKAGFTILRSGPIEVQPTSETGQDDDMPFASGSVCIEARREAAGGPPFHGNS